MTMRANTYRCQCGHTEGQHSAIFGLCKGVKFPPDKGDALLLGRLCHCARFEAAPELARMGWHERFVRAIRNVWRWM
jgi:hypothetical protein